MTGVIPRYLPAVGFADAIRLCLSSNGAAHAPAARFVPDMTAWHAYAFQRGRHGLAAWLRSLPVQHGGRVLVSAQICPAVREAIVAADLTPAFIDVDDGYPSPSPSQFAAALTGGVAAIIVAPMYGYIQDNWTALAAAVGATPLCVDMAQGLLLDDRLAPLLARADATLYSLSLGKGLDIGGGLLFLRRVLPGTAGMRSAPAVHVTVLAAGLAWRSLVASGLYRAAVRFIDDAIERDQDEPIAADALTPRDPSHHLAGWGVRLDAFADDVKRARACARRIGALPSVRASCSAIDVYCDDEGATHLRQVLRLRDPDRRTSVIATMRRLGIDCAPAGEPLPSGSDSRARFPNAARFAGDAIRFPFLGRLSDGEHARFERALGAALA